MTIEYDRRNGKWIVSSYLIIIYSIDLSRKIPLVDYLPTSFVIVVCLVSGFSQLLEFGEP